MSQPQHTESAEAPCSTGEKPLLSLSRRSQREGGSGAMAGGVLPKGGQEGRGQEGSECPAGGVASAGDGSPSTPLSGSPSRRHALLRAFPEGRLAGLPSSWGVGVLALPFPGNIWMGLITGLREILPSDP